MRSTPGVNVVLFLTKRESRLLRRLAQGQSDRKIAWEMGGTLGQIADQRQRLLGRLGLNSDNKIKRASKTLARVAGGIYSLQQS